MMSRELELENANLKEEYNHLKIVGCQMPSLAGAALNQPDVTLGGLNMNSTEAEMLAEAAMLREHRARLENRMSLLEEHNRQLESQLGKLKQILEVTHTYHLSLSSKLVKLGLTLSLNIPSELHQSVERMMGRVVSERRLIFTF